MTIVGDGNQRRDFTHVSDVVRANIMDVTKEVDSTFGEVYNIGTGTNYSINQIARMIDWAYTNNAPRPGEARISLANNQKMRKTFDWSPL